MAKVRLSRLNRWQKMPPYSKIYASKGPVFITVLCLMCKEPIEEEQRKRGKAFCGQCEDTYFPLGPVAPTEKVFPGQVIFSQRWRREEEIILGIMRRAFNRFLWRGLNLESFWGFRPCQWKSKHRQWMIHSRSNRFQESRMRFPLVLITGPSCCTFLTEELIPPFGQRERGGAGQTIWCASYEWEVLEVRL